MYNHPIRWVLTDRIIAISNLVLGEKCPHTLVKAYVELLVIGLLWLQSSKRKQTYVKFVHLYCNVKSIDVRFKASCNCEIVPYKSLSLVPTFQIKDVITVFPWLYRLLTMKGYWIFCIFWYGTEKHCIWQSNPHLLVNRF